jgi:hypothetical protein
MAHSTQDMVQLGTCIPLSKSLDFIFYIGIADESLEGYKSLEDREPLAAQSPEGSGGKRLKMWGGSKKRVARGSV